VSNGGLNAPLGDMAKWLAFLIEGSPGDVVSVAGKMFAVVNLEPPHSTAFKCTPETFGELVERPGIIPAPYMARNMWVQEQELGDALERRELASLVKASYDLVVAKLPK